MNPFVRLYKAIKEYSRIRSVETELFRMSDRELADIGILRAEIRRVARM